MINSRFKVLRRENRRWLQHAIVRSREGAILHNMTIRMVQDGELISRDCDDLVMELFNEEQEIMWEVNMERNEIDSELHEKFREHAEEYVIRE